MTKLGKEFGYLEVHPDKPEDRRGDRSVLLLLHGLGGDIYDWRFPQVRDYHFEHTTPANRHDNNNWHPPVDVPFSNFSMADMKDDVRCWSGILRGLDHTVINYSQDGPNDVVEVPLAQFVDKIVPFIRDTVLQGQLQGKRVTVLCHSRGGILIRKYLADHPQDGQDWIERVITLCSPHGATMAPLAISRLADIANALAILTVPLVPAGPAIAVATYVLTTHVFDLYDVGAGQQQLLPGDPLFSQLALPADVPAIRFFTFGGSSVEFTDFYWWQYLPSSYVPNLSDFPDTRFDWTEIAIKIPVVSPMVNSIPDVLLFEEQHSGKGDVAVTVGNSRLVGATNVTLPINHAEALWDEELFSRVADILGTPLNTAAAIGCGVGIIANVSTRQFHDPSLENTNCQLDEILERRLFDTPAEAIAEGYDGCFWCKQGPGPNG